MRFPLNTEVCVLACTFASLDTCSGIKICGVWKGNTSTVVPFLSVGACFQDSQWVPEASDNTEPFILCAMFFL